MVCVCDVNRRSFVSLLLYFSNNCLIPISSCPPPPSTIHCSGSSTYPPIGLAAVTSIVPPTSSQSSSYSYSLVFHYFPPTLHFHSTHFYSSHSPTLKSLYPRSLIIILGMAIGASSANVASFVVSHQQF